ncbi:MAG: hypothetical protein Q6351_009910 [Candidatus Njordarchaeum guaymaensis]
MPEKKEGILKLLNKLKSKLEALKTEGLGNKKLDAIAKETKDAELNMLIISFWNKLKNMNVNMALKKIDIMIKEIEQEEQETIQPLPSAVTEMFREDIQWTNVPEDETSEG